MRTSITGIQVQFYGKRREMGKYAGVFSPLSLICLFWSHAPFSISSLFFTCYLFSHLYFH